jgi:hypothetical protein
VTQVPKERPKGDKNREAAHFLICAASRKINNVVNAWCDVLSKEPYNEPLFWSHGGQNGYAIRSFNVKCQGRCQRELNPNTWIRDPGMGNGTSLIIIDDTKRCDPSQLAFPPPTSLSPPLPPPLFLPNRPYYTSPARPNVSPAKGPRIP